MQVAIIGGGVSGLSTAYYLLNTIPGVQISIYESANNVGGNASTFQINMKNFQGQTIERWVDMGVNDFNKATYKNLVALWKQLKIMDPSGKSDYCSPLINAESFSVPDANFQYRYAIDIYGKVFVPTTSTANAANLQKDIDQFKIDLATWYKSHETEGSTDISIGEWLKVPGTDQLRYSGEFIFGNLYPRINGMYFTAEKMDTSGVPPLSEMPLWMVAHYYILQEGYGQKKTTDDDTWSRQYFVDGSQTWLDFLATQLHNTGQVEFNISTPVTQVTRIGGAITVFTQGSAGVPYDKVIFATHPDVTYNMLGNDLKSEEIAQSLPQFTMTQATAYIHQDPSFVPADIGSTYNIHDYNYFPNNSVQETFPYTITYIVNYHQNDSAAGINDPLFYCTLNPQWCKQNPGMILNQTNGQPAILPLRHCKLDVNAMNGQIAINKIQMNTPGTRDYYFAGSFTVGAGLHEECIIQAQAIAQKIANPSYVPDHIYNFDKTNKRHFAPQYILDAINLTD